MKKLKLNLENLEVESFETGANGMRTMTVKAYQEDYFNMDPYGGGGDGAQLQSDSDASCWASCPTDGCGTCYKTCWHTCAASCPGTSGETTVE